MNNPLAAATKLSHLDSKPGCRVAEQEKTSPELTTVWSLGATWGFMYVVLEGDTMHIEAVVPATDFIRQSRVEKVATFPRRNRDER